MKINPMNLLVKLFCVSLIAFGFSLSAVSSQEKMENWHHQTGTSEFPTGIGSSEFYSNMPSATSRKIVVAILESGVDIGHPDLQDNIWINPGEIAGNKKDDDGNGYVDDIHGWNFIGGPDGRSVLKESYEVTRVYAREKDKWANVDASKLKGKKKKEYQKYLEIKCRSTTC